MEHVYCTVAFSEASHLSNQTNILISKEGAEQKLTCRRLDFQHRISKGACRPLESVQSMSRWSFCPVHNKKSLKGAQIRHCRWKELLKSHRLCHDHKVIWYIVIIFDFTNVGIFSVLTSFWFAYIWNVFASNFSLVTSCLFKWKKNAYIKIL